MNYLYVVDDATIAKEQEKIEECLSKYRESPIHLGSGVRFLFGYGGNKPDESEFLVQSFMFKEASKWNSFLTKFAVTESELSHLGGHFPQGHPRVGVLYKLHPLANKNKKLKKNFYIPETNYEQYLAEEKEEELLKLLIELGATKIAVFEQESSQNKSRSTQHVETDIAVASASFSSLFNQESNRAHRVSTALKLKGKKWCIGDTVDISEHPWLECESSWRTIVKAREVGGCTEYRFETEAIFEESIIDEIPASIRVKIYGSEYKREKFDYKHSLFKKTLVVEFSEPQT